VAEIGPVAVGRSTPPQTLPRTSHHREELDRRELLQARSGRRTKKVEKAAAEVAHASKLRVQTISDERRTRVADLKLHEAQRRSQDIQTNDHKVADLHAGIADEVQRARAREDQPGPLAPLPPGELVGTVLTAADIEAKGRLNSVPDAITGPPPAEEFDFGQLEGDRAVRLADRNESDRDLQVQQQIDQQSAEDQIANIPFDPNLPRGSIVDIFG